MSIQSERLLRLASFLERLPPEKYEHNMYHCGTRGCALGWAAYAKSELGFDDLALRGDTSPINPAQCRYDVAREYFGERSPERIFVSLGQAHHDKSRNGVIRAIREYAAELAGEKRATHEACEPEFKSELDSLLARVEAHS